MKWKVLYYSNISMALQSFVCFSNRHMSGNVKLATCNIVTQPVDTAPSSMELACNKRPTTINGKKTFPTILGSQMGFSFGEKSKDCF